MAGRKIRQFVQTPSSPTARSGTEPLPTLLDRGFHALPHPEKLATGLKEQVFVEQAIIEQCTGLIPITEHHHGVRTCFRPWCRDLHGVLQTVREVILEKPIARLPQSGFAAHLVDLQMELCLFVRGFRFHGCFYLLFGRLMDFCLRS